MLGFHPIAAAPIMGLRRGVTDAPTPARPVALTWQVDNDVALTWQVDNDVALTWQVDNDVALTWED